MKYNDFSHRGKSYLDTCAVINFTFTVKSEHINIFTFVTMFVHVLKAPGLHSKHLRIFLGNLRNLLENDYKRLYILKAGENFGKSSCST